MTDNRTTELREKLDALGIEHFDYDKGGRTQTQWEAPDGKRHFTYETSNNPAKTARLVIAWFPKPDQAIAATLGNGMLTAEQVREAIEGNAWAETSTIFEFGDSSWQAIADELNAELGSEECETCHGESDLSEWVCSECQCWIPLGLTPENIGHASEWRYCPHCGREVKAVKR